MRAAVGGDDALPARPDVVALDHLVERRRLQAQEPRGLLLHAARAVHRGPEDALLVPADRLVERLSGVIPKDKIIRSTVSPVLGTYGGPGAVAVTVLETESK